jgi:hypothetical protein
MKIKKATDFSVAGGFGFFAQMIQAKRRDFVLNKNATGMGAPVAIKSNQKDRLNCYAETRPKGYV